MKIFHAASDFAPPTGRVCVAIGMFDGVHLGHQQVLCQTAADAHQHEAVSLCVTFKHHPATVIDPDRAPRLIQSLPQRLAAIESLGINATLLLYFDEDLSQVSATDFIYNLHHDLGEIKSLCVGAKFAFGRDRRGNVDLLKQLGDELRFTVHGLASVALDGDAVSSTRIRQFVTDGRLDAATQMLGREYALGGEVIKGDQRGRTIGRPTANIDCTGLCTPPYGVYAAYAEIGGQTHRAAINLGRRPTVNDSVSTFHAEAHLLDFDADIYGQYIELTFIRKIREEKFFVSLEALNNQIEKDIEIIRDEFASL